jgi:serine/threonine-protein kinase HipA
MSDTLAVWLGADRVGDLVRDRQALTFHRRQGTARLTVAQADGDEPQWSPAFTRAWFDGLLPEEERRSAAEVEHGVDRGDTFGLLAAIGWECAGAVSVLPEGRLPASGWYQALSDDDVWARLDALPRRAADIDHQVRLSLGGAQDKLLLARLDGRWQLPLDGAISTHILKPEPVRFPGLAVAEGWALRAAAGVTRTATAELLAAPGHRPTLVVERYDRQIRDGAITRTHQEDLCQVLGLASAAKYPRGQGPRDASLRRLADLLVARATDAPAELLRLLEQVVVTVALANTDAHAKNLSLVHAGPNTVTLAPLYDIAPTLFFLPTQRQAALPIGHKWRIDEITRRHLLEEARAWGVPDPIARATISSALERLENGTHEADAEYPGLPGGMRGVVRFQLERLATSEF